MNNSSTNSQLFLPSLSVPQVNLPQVNLPQVYVPQVTLPNFKPAYTFYPQNLKPYNRDKTFKDLGDIVFETQAFRDALNKYNLDWVYKNPLTNILGIDKIVGAGVLIKDRTIDPLLHARYGEVLVNTLETLGDSLDLLSNPVKGFVLEGPSGFQKAIGYTEDGYKKTYQYNTGNFIADIVLETMSDPVNWFTLGAKQAASVGIKKSAKELSEATAKEIGSEAAEKISKRTYKQMALVLSKADKDSKELAIEIITARLRQNQDEAIKLLAKSSDLSDEAIQRIIANYDDLVKLANSEKYIKALTRIQESKSMRLFNNAVKVKTAAKEFDENLTKVVFGLTPQIPISKLVIEKYVKPRFKHLLEWTRNRLAFIRKSDYLTTSKEVQELKERIIAKADNSRKIIRSKNPNVKSIDDILEAHGITFERLVDEYINVFRHTPEYMQTSDLLRFRFFERLRQLVPGLPYYNMEMSLPINKVLNNVADITKDIKVKPTMLEVYNNIEENFKDIIDTVEETALVIELVDQSEYNLFKEAVEQDMSKWFSKSATDIQQELYKTFGMMSDEALAEVMDLDTTPIEKVLKYVDERLLSFIMDDRKVTLQTLPEYLRRLKKTDRNAYTRLVTFLNQIGITPDNCQQVYHLMHTKGDKAKKQLQAVLTAGKTDNLLSSDVVQSSAEELSTHYVPLKNMKVDLDENDKTLLRALQSNTEDDDVLNKATQDLINKSKVTVTSIEELQNELLDISKPVTIKQIGENEYVAIPFDFNTGTYDDFKETDLAKEIDSLMSYAGTEKQNSEFIYELLSFKIDNNTTTEQLKNYSLMLDDFQRMVKLWNVQITETLNAPYQKINSELNYREVTKYLKDTITDWYDALKEIEQKNVILRDFLDAETNYYTIEVSRQGSYYLTCMSIQSNEHLEGFLKDLSDINSSLRNNLRQAANTLYSNGTPESYILGNTIEHICATTDANNLLSNLLNTAYFLEDSQYVNKEAKEFVLNSLFNAIYRNRNIYIDMVDDSLIQNIVNDCITQLKASKYGDMADWIREDILYDTLKTYVTEMQKLDKHYSIYLTLGMYWDNFTVAEMNMLGEEAPTILQMLRESDNNLVVEDTGKFISKISGVEAKDLEMTTEEKRFFISTIQDDANRDMLLHGELKLDDYLDEQANESLARTLTQSFTNENVINNYLKGITDGTHLKYGKKPLYDAQTVVSAEVLNSYLCKITGFRNCFEWGVQNGFLTAKKVFDKDFIKDAQLVKGVIKAQGYEAELLNSKLYTYAKRAAGPKFLDGVRYMPDTMEVTQEVLEEYMTDLSKSKKYGYMDVYTSEYVDALRKALQNTYASTTNTFGPVNPVVYFAEIKPEYVFAWHNYSRNVSCVGPEFAKVYSSNFVKPEKIYTDDSGIRHYTLRDRLKYYMDPMSAYESLDALNEYNGFSSDKAWSDLVSESPREVLNDIYEGFDGDIMKPFKGVEDMTKSRFQIQKYIQNDKKYWDNTKPLVWISEDNRLVTDVVEDEEALEILQSYGIRLKETKDIPADVIGSHAVQSFMTRERTQALLYNFNRWNPLQMRSWIDHNTQGVLLIYDEDLVFDVAKDWEQAGLKLEKVQLSQAENDIIYVLSKTDDNIVNVAYDYVLPQHIFKEQQDIITSVFKNNRAYYNTTVTDVPEDFWTGEYLDKETYENILNSERFAKALDEETKQKVYSKLSNYGSNNIYRNEELVLNFSIIGAPNAFNRVLDSVDDVIKHPEYVTTDLTRRAFNSNLLAIKRQNNINKYMQVWFGGDFSLDGKLFRFLQDPSVTDAEIKELFTRNNWDVVILKENKKGKPWVYRISVENKKELIKAAEEGASAVPHEAYRNMVLTINKREVNNKFFNLYNRAIVGTYKTTYLGTIGMLMRNFLDSAIWKNATTLDGITSIPSVMLYDYKAMKLIADHNAIQEMVFKKAEQKLGYRTFDKNLLRETLNDLLHEQDGRKRIEQYILTDLFVNSSASGGLSKVMSEYLLNYNVAHADPSSFLIEKYIDEVVMNWQGSPFHWINEINNKIEQSSRYGLFLKLIDEGTLPDEAIRKVVQTHFDYELAHNQLQLLEQFFWFSTFPINNFMYYMNEGLTKNPDMLKLQMDMMQLSWNDGEYTWDDIKHNRYLLSQVARGNIRFKIAGKNVVLKTGSSILDVFNLVTDPIGEIKDRLNPFIAAPLGFRDKTNLIPFYTQYRNINKARQGVTLVPSVYDILTKNPYHGYKTSFKKNYPKSTWTKIPRMKKVPKPNNRNYTNYSRYNKRYYFANKYVNYKWLTTTTGLAPYFLDPFSEVATRDRRFRRMVSRMKIGQQKRETI